ncbi:MAG: hypothetical protein COA44_13500 [Arcobacter sp.]|nr:MAG: hypothetical protein COA44_13500 [Arcobacter sp.]
MIHSDTSDKIDEYTRNYLLENFNTPFYASDFSQTHFDTLMQDLFDNFTQEKANARMMRIRTCIEEHFLDLSQICEVSIREGKIKVVKHLQEGMKTLEEDKAFIDFSNVLKNIVNQKKEYEIQSYLLCFPEDILEELFKSLSSLPLAKDKARLRELIRESLEGEFALQTRDIILFLRKKLYVRYFVEMKQTSNEEKRFLGMAPEDLEALYKKHFPQGFEDTLLEMAPEVISDALNFSHIDNFSFKAKYIEVFRTLVDVAMVEYTRSLDEESVRGLNGYILRLHFDSLLYLCAQILVEMVMKRDRRADAFLRFYNGDTIVNKAGKNIKKPFVKDEKGNNWNYSSIFSIMTQASQYENQHDNQVKLILESEQQHKESKQMLSQSKQIHKKHSETLSLLKDELHACTLVKESLITLKSPSKDETSKLNLKRQEENRLLTKHDTAFSQHNESAFKLDNAKILEKNRLKQFNSSKLALVRLEEKGKQLELQQDNIFSALAKALIFR